MTTNRARPGFILTSLSALIVVASLSGCLSSSGSSSSSRATEPEANPLLASTSEGDIQGIALNGMRVFRGIPYAAAPVGELRLAPTQAAAQRDAVLELSEEFGAMCPQTSLMTGQPQGDEDCLFLNVYTPDQAEDLPVMVWIHGGAFVFGDGGGEYDPTRLVQQDVIVVTLNYRLGNLGFMAHPSLESDGGNFGLMDQQQALRWVKQNIQAFGGDPDNVTIFGESAGGHSVMSHVVSPRAQSEELFHKAIVQSGSYAPFQVPKVAAQFGGVQIANALGCDDLATAADCLRALPVPALLAAQGSQSMPSVDPDSDLLPLSIMAALQTGQFNTNLDMMIGSNQNEGTLFIALDELGGASLETLGEAEYRSRVTSFFAPYQASVPYDDDQIASDYLGFYASESAPLSTALSAIWTDFMFACNSSLHAGTFAAQGMNTFKYWFRDDNAPWTLVSPALVSFDMGATHAGEIPYVLYPQELMRERYTGTDEEIDNLAGLMVDYWTSFAKFGDPNTSDGVAPAWPQAADNQYLVLDPPQPASTSALTFLGYHRCGYWANPPLR